MYIYIYIYICPRGIRGKELMLTKDVTTLDNNNVTVQHWLGSLADAIGYIYIHVVRVCVKIYIVKFAARSSCSRTMSVMWMPTLVTLPGCWYWVYIHMYVCVRVCVCLRVCVHIYILEFAARSSYSRTISMLWMETLADGIGYVCVCVCVCVCACVYIYIKYVYKCLCMCMYMYMCICTWYHANIGLAR